jgi:hypothetical protein
MLERHNGRLNRRGALGLVAGYLKSVTSDRWFDRLHVSPMFGAYWRMRVRAMLFDGQGVHDDGTLSRTAHFLFPRGVAAGGIQFALERADTGTGPLDLRLVVNGRSAATVTAPAPGPFVVTAPYDPHLDYPTSISLHADRTYAYGHPLRRRACRLRGLSWVDASGSPVASITP